MYSINLRAPGLLFSPEFFHHADVIDVNLVFRPFDTPANKGNSTAHSKSKDQTITDMKVLPWITLRVLHAVQ